MDLLKQLENDDLFSASELIIRDYVLHQKENIDNFTVSELSIANFVSKSTLVRFSKKLGYAGWNSFKKDFLRFLDIEKSNVSNVDYNFPFGPSDRPLFISQKLLVMKKSNLSDTFNLLDSQQLNRALQLISSQDRIHIFAEGHSLLASQDFCFRMTRISKNITNANEIGLVYVAKTLKKSDLAIIVSYSGKTSNVVKAAHVLKANKVPIISLTSQESNPISRLSEVNFQIPDKEDLYSKISNFSTVDSMRYIFDILYSIYFNLNYNINLEARVSTAKVVDVKGGK